MGNAAVETVSLESPAARAVIASGPCVLLLDASGDLHDAVHSAAVEQNQGFHSCSTVDSLGDYFRVGQQCSVLVCALPLPDDSLRLDELLAMLRGSDPTLQVIVIGETATPEGLRETLQAGALDCLFRPLVPAALRRSMAHALHIRRMARANQTLERARETERRHYESILEHAATAIVETTPALDVTYANGAAERLLGVPVARLVGSSLLETVYPDPDYALGVREIYESTILSGLAPDHTFTTAVVLPNGDSRSVRWSARTYRHATGETRIINVGEDMTTAARLEERVRSLISELNRKNHELTATNSKNERLQMLVRQYVPRSTWVRADLHASQGMVEIPIERMELTCLFMDIAGFTSFTENSGVDDVVDFLNEVFAMIAQVVERFNGDIDKFMGDACFAVFEDPLNACKAALRIQQCMRVLNERRRVEGTPCRLLRCGINTGPVIRGNVGGAARKDNTLIGDAVNTASRLESSCRPGSVLVGADTYRLVAELVDVSSIEELTLKGKSGRNQAFYVRNVVRVADAEAKEPL